MTGFRDASHYNPAVGQLVLRRVPYQAAEDVPDDFGVLVSSSNIDLNLGSVRRDRERWRSSHHTDHEEIRLLAARVFAKEQNSYEVICPKMPSN